jgi:hypothetical protein
MAELEQYLGGYESERNLKLHLDEHLDSLMQHVDFFFLNCDSKSGLNDPQRSTKHIVVHLINSLKACVNDPIHVMFESQLCVFERVYQCKMCK